MDSPILALVASFFAMSFAVSSYFAKKKYLYLLLQMFCILFLVVSYFFSMQFFAMIGLAISLARVVVYYAYEKKDMVAPLSLAYLFSILTILGYLIVNLLILKTAQYADLLLVMSNIGFAFVFRVRDLKIVRFGALIPLILAVLFNTVTNAPLFATASYSFELCANVISIYRYHIRGEKPKVEQTER